MKSLSTFESQIVAGEPGKSSTAANVVHHMAELMENGAHLATEKHRLFGTKELRFCEVTNEYGRRL